MSTPLPLIEFSAFIGVVLYLFVMQSSSARRNSSSSEQADDAGDSSASPEDRKDGSNG